MSDPERHEMQLQQSFPSGAQEWLCTTCNRRVVIEHGANRVKIIALDPLDRQGRTEDRREPGPRIRRRPRSRSLRLAALIETAERRRRLKVKCSESAR
jgi:hypothetical protein